MSMQYALADCARCAVCCTIICLMLCAAQYVLCYMLLVACAVWYLALWYGLSVLLVLNFATHTCVLFLVYSIIIHSLH